MHDNFEHCAVIIYNNKVEVQVLKLCTKVQYLSKRTWCLSTSAADSECFLCSEVVFMLIFTTIIAAH